MFRSRKNNPRKSPGPEPFHDDMVVVVDRAVNPFLVMFHDPASFRAEQVRSLRNKLIAMNPDGAPKTLAITSAVRNEGKTVSSLNLAMAFAELERESVLIVDGDLRRPRVERDLNLSPAPGLSELLQGRIGLDAAVRDAGVRNMAVIGAGAPVSTPAELLSGARIDDLYDRLKSRYQYVLIDTPPVLPTSDAGMWASRADGTMIVVRLEHSSRSHTREAIRTLEDLGANVMGTLVTEVRGADPQADRKLTYEEEEG